MNVLDWQRVQLEGTQLIEASAGTGKTHTLTTLVLRLLLERRLRIDQILIVTFTNAAAAELRDRVRKRLRAGVLAFGGAAAEQSALGHDEQLAALVSASRDRERDRYLLSEALRGMDESAIFTIHGFCQRVLSEYAFESGAPFEIELLPEGRALVADVVDDFWARELYSAPEVLIAYLEQVGFKRSWLVDLARLLGTHPDLTLVLGSGKESGEPIFGPTGCAVSVQALSGLHEAHADAAQVWAQSRAEILSILGSPALNRVRYPARSLARWCVEMDEVMAHRGAVPAQLFPQFVKFTRAALAEATRQGKETPSHPFFACCDRLLARTEALNSELERQKEALIARFLREVRGELEKRKQKSGVQCFDDLLLRVRGALRADGGAALAARIRERYPAALVDEFQDTDPLQYELLCRIWRDRGSALFLIGDPKQAIYGFRGADVFAYLSAAEGAGAQRWTLQTNFRSGPGLIAALDTLFSRSERPFLLPEIRFTRVAARPGACDQLRAPGGAELGGLELLYVPGEPQPGQRDARIPKRRAAALVPDLVAGHVARLLSAGLTVHGCPLEPGDMAVLTRTNAEAFAMQRALRAIGVDSVLQSDSSVLDSPEAQEVARVLRGLSNPTDTTALRSALATRIVGVSGTELERLRGAEQDWDRWVEAFGRWHELWLGRGFVQAFSRMLKDLGTVQRMLGEIGGERRVTNVLHLMELLHQAGSRERLGSAALIGWFESARFDPATRDEIAREAVQIRLESDARKLKVTTVHKSKGLEYGVVFCPFLWDGALVREAQKRFTVYHDPAAKHRAILDVRAPAEKERELELLHQEALAEALRLTYVGLTRAKHRVIAVCGPFNTYENSALGWLLHRSPCQGIESERSSRERIRDADDELLTSELRTLTEASHHRISVVRAELDMVSRWTPPRESELSVAPWSSRRQLDVRRRTSSFTALASTKSAPRGPAASGADRDTLFAVERSRSGGEPSELPLDRFPRGAGPGTLLHSVLELSKFEPSATAERRSIIVDQLRRHRIPEQEWADTLGRAIDDVLATPLDDDGLCLHSVSRERRASELEFTLPVAESAAEARRSSNALNARAISAIFRQHAATPPMPVDYPAKLERLEFPALRGFLRGFIDLVFEHQGRYYLVDWKSNHLGATWEDYATDPIAHVMAEHHYFLQYHLYVVAVHRLLAQRLPGYDYDRHFGGVFYLFLRGMSVRHGARRGVFRDRPTLACVEALSRVLERPLDDAGAARERRP